MDRWGIPGRGDDKGSAAVLFWLWFQGACVGAIGVCLLLSVAWRLWLPLIFLFVLLAPTVWSTVQLYRQLKVQ